MSKPIEELQIKHDFLSRQIADYKRVLLETEDEIKAIMAESARPREWNIVKYSHSEYIAYPKKREDLLCPKGGEIITVREVVPLVITRETAKALDLAWDESAEDESLNETYNIRMRNPKFWPRVLKVLGIDAIPEGGK